MSLAGAQPAQPAAARAQPANPAAARRWVLRFGVATTTVFVTLLILELALRAHLGEWRFVNFWAMRQDLFRAAYPAEFDAELGWRPSPGAGRANIWQTRVTIGSDGLRANGAASTATQITNTGLVVAVGDSFTFGDEVDDDQTWPAQLEAKLNRPVLNGGVFSYGLEQTVLRMGRLAASYQPEVVIASLIAEDILRCGQSMRTGAAKPYFTEENGRLVLHTEHVVPTSRSVGLVRPILGFSLLVDGRMLALLPRYWLEGAMSGRQVTGSNPEQIACRLVGSIGEIRQSVPSIERVVLLVQDELREVPGRDAMTERVLACVDRTNVEVVDLREELRRVRDENPARHRGYFKSSHMSAAGNRFVADRLAAVLDGRQSK